TDGQINWAYSELFQNYSQDQIKDYLGYAQGVSAGKGVLVHYAETHDNDRLAKKGKVYTLSRLYLCAFTSFSGAWGFANGVEWLATERIDVHRNSGLSWGAEENLVGEISQINRILADNPAFWATDNLEFVETGNEQVLGFMRADEVKSNIIFCLINLNTEGNEGVSWDISQNRLAGRLGSGTVLHNLLDDEVGKLSPEKANRVELQPGQCLLYRLEKVGQPVEPTVPAICRFEYEKISLIYQILLSRFKPHEVGRIDQEELLREVNDYRKFIVLVNTVSLEYLIHHDISDMLSGVEDDMIDHYSAVWTFRESSKEFIISGDKWLIVHTFVPCTAYLKTSEGTLRMESILGPDGVGYLSCFPPQAENQSSLLTFNWKIERNKKIIRQWQEEKYPILSVPSGHKEPRLRKIYPIKLKKNQLRENYPTVLLTNGRGGLCQCPGRPGVINSKYDALLAITPDDERPAYRVALVKTLKETIQVGQKFFDLDESFLNTFTRFPQPVWEFVYDDGEYYIVLERSLIMPHGHNTVFVRYKLREANTAVILTSKCCLEFRNIHDRVKVAQDENLQNRMTQSCRATTSSDGVVFTPQKGISVEITARNGEYIEQPHWVYDLYFPEDAERQVEARGDAFAPGVFNFELRKRDSAVLTITAKVEVETETEAKAEETAPLVRSGNAAMVAENQRVKDLLNRVPAEAAQKDSFVKMLVCAMDQFLVRFNNRWLLWGGYPWLSLQVRGSLHCVGGLLAAGREDAAKDVILLSASTASQGLLLDWLDGTSTERTDTEASLRLFTAAYNYVGQTGDTSFWDCGVGTRAGLSNTGTTERERSLREVLVDIYEHFRNGNLCKNKDCKAIDSSNNDRPGLDHKSGLLYSPAGFSWMNTSHPCATPRGGYPIEVQALWYRALGVLAEIHPPYRGEAEQLREQIAEKFMDWYWSDKREYLADVLIADRNTLADKAPPDSSLRFNQLAAINANLVPLEEARQIVDIISRRLLIPGGVRSLSEEPLATPLKIVDDKGILLADPRMPYQGACVGGEVARRVAYHNGTAWPSAYPSFIEARASVFCFTDLAVKQALAFFEPTKTHLTEGGIGNISEMKDGNYPHRPRGCYAYALGVAET
ncbi:MAG: glycogen debranching enzyme family protein, partial [Sedimentisphaerales bacterium]|nr:glycogen debranching enzyme family protein [Sedimentisphaerales bacterium]